VNKIGSFLRDRAGRWYMDFVAPNPRAYTVDSLKMALFNYFFPIDLKEKLRRDFHRMCQGEMRIVDYVCALKRLQKRLPDISDRQICIKLWHTVHIYICVKWTDTGMTAEDTELDELCEAAQCYEASEKIQQEYKNRGNMRGSNRRYDNRKPNEQNRSHEPAGTPVRGRQRTQRLRETRRAGKVTVHLTKARQAKTGRRATNQSSRTKNAMSYERPGNASTAKNRVTCSKTAPVDTWPNPWDCTARHYAMHT
jgi:hypothetical protein